MSDSMALWTPAHQASLSMGFSRQEYCSVLPCPPAGDLPNLETESASLMSHVLTGRFFTTSSTWEAPLKGEVAQSCLTLCDPMDCSLAGSSVHGNFQAIVLERIAISFTRGSSQPRD